MMPTTTMRDLSEGRLVDLDAEDDLDEEEDTQEVTYGDSHSQQPESNGAQLTLNWTQDSHSTKDGDKMIFLERDRRREARKRRMEPQRLQLYSETNDTTIIDDSDENNKITNEADAPTKNPLDSLKSILENESREKVATGTENRVNDATANFDAKDPTIDELTATRQLDDHHSRSGRREAPPHANATKKAPASHRSWIHPSNDDGFGHNMLSKSRRAFDKLKSKKQHQSRTPVAPEGTKRSDRVESSQKNTASSSKSRAKPEFVESKNGNGMMIPKHWGVESTQSGRGKTKKNAALSARSSEKKSRRLSHDSKSRPSKRRRRSVLVQPLHLRESSPSASHKPFPKSPLAVPESRSISFAPSFLSNKTSTVAQDPVVDRPFESEDIARPQNNNGSTLAANIQDPGSFAQSTRRPTTLQQDFDDSGDEKETNKIGKWSMRYKQFSNAMRTDNLRMKSSSVGGDPMDPRRRATFYSDITVLSDEIVPWSSEPHEGSTFFVFLHQHAEKGTSVDGKRGLAWCFVPASTVREHSLQAGTQLRLYNSTVFGRTPRANECTYSTIISSTIVSRYPQTCPPLPDLQDLIKQENLEYLLGSEGNVQNIVEKSNGEVQ